MARCLISFGANLGDAKATIRTASDLLCQYIGRGSSDFHLSRFFRTAPIGGPSGQPPFINAVATLDTPASIWEVWRCTSQIEAELGRVRNLRWEARRIDIDILLYEDARIWTPHLKVPHPRFCMRRFILLPAVDVAPHWIEPVSGCSIQQLADDVSHRTTQIHLIAQKESRAAEMLVDVSLATGAEWSFVHVGTKATGSISATATEFSGSTRKLNLLEVSSFGSPDANAQITAALQTQTFASSGVTIVLAPQSKSEDAHWEDVHRNLAIALNLNRPENLDPNTPARTADANAFSKLKGPRYLLSSDDRRWAIAELIAAFEAMDCPVEAIG